MSRAMISMRITNVLVKVRQEAGSGRSFHLNKKSFAVTACSGLPTNWV